MDFSTQFLLQHSHFSPQFILSFIFNFQTTETEKARTKKKYLRAASNEGEKSAEYTNENEKKALKNFNCFLVLLMKAQKAR